jgi:hypothetical protein
LGRSLRFSQDTPDSPDVLYLVLSFDWRGSIGPSAHGPDAGTRGLDESDHFYTHNTSSEHETFQKTVVPYLETNRLRPRLLAIQKTSPLAYRAKVLGPALLTVQTDPNQLWMLLSGNAEIALLSIAATTTPTANFPTPATDAAATVTATRVGSTTGA